MELSKKFERIQQDIFVLQKDLLQDLHRLLKVDFSAIDKHAETVGRDRIDNFLNKTYDFAKYNEYLSELLMGIDDLEANARRLPELTETLRVTKKEYEDKKSLLTNTNYELGLIRENYQAEVNSLNREHQLATSLAEELQKKIEEEDNRHKRKIAEVNKLNLEIQNIKHRGVAQSNLMKKADIEREAQVTRLKERMIELGEIAESKQEEFEEQMIEKEALIQELQRKIILVDKEIELLKDMESLKSSEFKG